MIDISIEKLIHFLHSGYFNLILFSIASKRNVKNYFFKISSKIFESHIFLDKEL